MALSPLDDAVINAWAALESAWSIVSAWTTHADTQAAPLTDFEYGYAGGASPMSAVTGTVSFEILEDTIPPLIGSLTPDESRLFGMAVTDAQASILLDVISLIRTAKAQSPGGYGAGGPCVCFHQTFSSLLDTHVPREIANEWRANGINVGTTSYDTRMSDHTMIWGMRLPFTMASGHIVVSITVYNPSDTSAVGTAYADYGSGPLGLWGPLQGNSGGSDSIFFGDSSISSRLDALGLQQQQMFGHGYSY